MGLLEVRKDLSARALERYAIGLDLSKRREKGVRGVVDGVVRGSRTREQQREELFARRRHLDQRLVHQVQQQVAAADVYDECDARSEPGNVGEVLIRTHPDVGADRPERLLQRRDDVLKDGLVRNEVVRPKIPVGLGEFRDERPEGAIVEALGQRFGRRARRRRDAEQQRQDGEREDRKLGPPRARHLILGRIIT